MNTTSLDGLKARYQTLRGKQDGLVQTIEANKATMARLGLENEDINKAHYVIRELANQAQREFKDEVDGLVTLAVRSIFEEDFRFDLQMKTDGGRLQCKPTIWERIDENEMEYTPKDDMGGSVLDPMGFSLRVVLQQFEENPSRAMFWLDEPMKNIGHGALLILAGHMLAELSHSLILQLIIITHEPELSEIADMAWRVTRTRGVSKVRVMTPLNQPQQPTPQPKRKLVL